MKKILAIVIVLTLIFALAACGSKSETAPAGSAAEETGPSIVFKNEMSVTVDIVYIAPTDADMWGDPANKAPVKPGEELRIFSEILSDSGSVCSVGVTDQNGQNYDCYNVSLAADDTLSISEEGEGAIFTVTTQTGESASYNCNVFSE